MLEGGSLARQQILKARRLDEYQLGALQGRGGFASVYRCHLRSNPSIPALAMKIVNSLLIPLLHFISVLSH